jgi:hypothetical protein
MKSIQFSGFLFFVLLCSSIFGQVQVQAVGGNGADEVSKILSLPQGILVAGIYQNQMNWEQNLIVSNGNADVFLAWLDTSQQLQNIMSLGNLSNNTIHALDADSLGNIYLAMSFIGNIQIDSFNFQSNTNTVLLIKIDPLYSIQWVKAFDVGGVFQITDLKVDFNNQFIWLSGYYNQIFSFQGQTFATAAQYAPFVMKTKCINGELSWMQEANKAKYAKSTAIQPLDDGGGIVSGLFIDSLQVDDSLFYQSFTHTEIFMAKIDSAGNWIQVKHWGGVYDDEPKQLKFSPNKRELWLAGEFVGILQVDSFQLITERRFYDIFWIKLNTDLEVLQAGQSNTKANAYTKTIFVDSQKVLIGGYFQDSLEAAGVTHYSFGALDFFYFEINAQNAQLLRAKTSGGGRNDILNSLLRKEDKLCSAGYFQDQLNLSGQIINAQGFSDGWLRCEPWNGALSVMIQNTESYPFSLYPNPTREMLFINADEEGIWYLYDLQGRFVLSGKEKQIDLSSVKSGFYLLQWISKQQMKSVKIMKRD